MYVCAYKFKYAIQYTYMNVCRYIKKRYVYKKMHIYIYIKHAYKKMYTYTYMYTYI